MAATGTPTTNLGLRIMNGTDPVDVADINANSQTLDDKIGAVPSNTSVQAQIASANEAISNLNTSTGKNVSGTDISTLKTNLLTYANSMEKYEKRILRITAGFSDDNFNLYGVYNGEIYCIDKSGNTTTYFTALVSDQFGNTVSIGYANGTWDFKSFKATNSAKYQNLTDSSFAGTIYLRYASGIVVLNFYDFKVSSASATLSGIIPSSYRPSSTQTRGILQTADSSKFEFLQVRTNGDIDVNNSDTSKYYYGSIAYVI